MQKSKAEIAEYKDQMAELETRIAEERKEKESLKEELMLKTKVSCSCYVVLAFVSAQNVCGPCLGP